MTKALRIAFLTDYLGMLAGTEASLVDTAVELRRRGHEVIVGCFPRHHAVHPHWRSVLQKADIPLNTPVSGQPEREFCRELETRLRDWGTDVVHAIPLSELAIQWVELTCHTNIPFIGTETSEASEHCTWYDHKSSHLFQCCAALLAPCDRVAAGIRQTFGYKGRIAVIPHVVTVPEHRIAPMKRTDLVSLRHLGAITRLRLEKGPEFLIATLAILAQTQDVDLTIYGETSELERTLELATALGVSDRLTIAGPFRGQEEIDQVIEAHCIFLLSSLFEGLPLALLECCARGRLSISTDVGGVRELMAPIDPGCIVPVADPAAMASAVTRLLNNPDKVLELSRCSSALFRRRYHKDRVVPQLIDFYYSTAQPASPLVL